MFTDKSNICDGKVKSGAFRVVWQLRNVLIAFSKRLTHTIPLLNALSTHHADKTMTPQDVLNVDMHDHTGLWMKGDRYDKFACKHSDDWWYMQAIELNPPKLGEHSERYQFHNCPLLTWPVTIEEFMSGLRKVSIDAFARIKSGYDAGVPYDIESCDDMPVAVRIPKIPQISKPCCPTFLSHNHTTLSPYVRSGLVETSPCCRSSKTAGCSSGSV